MMALSMDHGDELLEQADGVSTQAIDIEAPPGAVWPWLAQMGPSPRGGAYAYDWIENLLGLNMHSAGGVFAEFQHPEVGETCSVVTGGFQHDEQAHRATRGGRFTLRG